MMGWQWTSRAMWAGLLGLVLLTGCPKKDDSGGADEAGEASTDVEWSDDDTQAEGQDEGGEAASSGEGVGEVNDDTVRPLGAADLQPVIQAVGTPGLPPTKIEIQFALPVVNGTRPASKKETKLLIKPGIAGHLRFSSKSTLTFTPRQPFKAGTRYEVSLAKVESRSGTITPAKPSPWVMSFTTPKFGLDRAMVDRVNYGRRQVTLKLFFTGPVTEKNLASRLYLSGESGRLMPSIKAARGPWFSRTGDGVMSSVFTVTVSGASVRPEKKLALKLAAGLPMAGTTGAKADEATREITLYGGASMVVREAAVAEGGNGFYLEVICDDDAVHGSRYYYDRNLGRSFSSLSPRCNLDEDEAEEKIHFSPKVAFTVSPSGGGFRVFGAFKRGAYSVRIDAGTRTLDGGILMKDFLRTFSVPARAPQLRFVAKGRYLPRAAWKQVPIAHLNLEKATLFVRVVPEKNLAFWMSDGSEGIDSREGDLVAQRTIPLKAAPDQMKTTWVDVSDLVPPETRGLVELSLQASGASDTSRIVLTDLHLVAKRAGADPKHPWGRSVTTWALGAEDGRLRSGVRIELIRPSGKVIGSCTTASEEGCRIDLPEAGVDPTEPFAILARHGDDLTYLKFGELRLSIEDAQVHGEAYRSRRKYRGYLYSDRGVYRPGEEAHLVALLRREAGSAPKAKMPVRMIVTDPRGKKIASRKLRTDAAGLVTLDLRFASFATTGHYTVKAKVARRIVGTYGFQVEEFVPERMKVEAQATQPGFGRGDAISVAVGARYLFGGVPEGGRVELSCRLLPASFSPAGVKGFTFSRWLGNTKAPRPLDLGLASGVLDAEGGTLLDCPSPDEGGSIDGPAKAIVRAAVFEAGSGRTTVGATSVMVHPEAYYIGISSKISRASQGKALPIEGVVVDWDGKPYGDLAELTVDFYRLEDEYGWYYDEDEGSRYRYWRRPLREARKTVNVKNGRFKTTWTPSVNARAYLVRAHAGEARVGLEVEGSGGYWYFHGAEEGGDSTPRPDKPSWLTITGPPKLEVGEAADFEFTAPFKGRVLFTAETDELLKTEWREVEAGPQRFSLELESFKPNVYVSALLFLDPEVRGSDAPSTRRAYGVQSFTVRPTAFTHTVQLDVPKEVRSNSKLTVSLDLGPLDAPALATIAAVDEGILSLTKFNSPDPLPAIFVRRGLGVATYETVGWSILLPPAGPGSSTGGDEDEEGEAGDLGRVQPIKPVALWSGVVKIPKSGKVKVSFDVPEYRGALRVMAVTADAEHMGYASAKVIVRDPIVVQATVPRFLTKDDTLNIPVFVTNVSGKDLDIKVKIALSPLRVPGLAAPEGDRTRPVKVLGDGQARMKLADGKSDTVVFKARVMAGSGAAHFTVSVDGGGHHFEQNNDVPILPSGPKTRVLKTLELEAGETDLRAYMKGWVPLSERSTFWVTDNPYAPAFDHLRALLRYPYGCIEQTTSAARPLLYLADQVARVDPEKAASLKVEDMVMAGVERIFSMQTPSGGFAYWPGGTDPQPWGTAYAIHFLLDAKKQRYPVDEMRLNDAIRWLDGAVKRYQSFDPKKPWKYYWGYYDEPYLHYVLALAGKGHKARAQELLGSGWWYRSWWTSRGGWRAGANAESRYLLEAAIYLSGDRRHERDLKHPDLTPYEGNTRSRGWSFYSDRRARAIMLNVFQDLFGNDPAGEPLARAVFSRLQGHSSSYYTTQELAWSISGLGKRVLGQGTTFGKPTLRANGKVMKAQPKAAGDKSADRSWALYRASEYDSLKIDLPSKGEGKVFLVLASEGVREGAAWKLGGAGLSLERTYYDSSGRTLSASAPKVKLGDVVYVKLSLSNTYAEDVSNIALVDRLPAGFEIENPRLGRGGNLSFLGDADRRWSADHMNIRDDRIEVFGTLRRGARVEVVYAVRATTAGVFTIPPTEAEAMYDPEIWARGGGGKLDVAGPWSE